MTRSPNERGIAGRSGPNLDNFDDVRRRTRAVLETWAAPGTGYCLGTGNSVANHIPLENYRAMLDEGRRWNRQF